MCCGRLDQGSHNSVDGPGRLRQGLLANRREGPASLVASQEDDRSEGMKPVRTSTLGSGRDPSDESRRKPQWQFRPDSEGS
eukprot:5770085-Heterocapsa_arctica.AAC.1